MQGMTPLVHVSDYFPLWGGCLFYCSVCLECHFGSPVLAVSPPRHSQLTWSRESRKALGSGQALLSDNKNISIFTPVFSTNPKRSPITAVWRKLILPQPKAAQFWITNSSLEDSKWEAAFCTFSFDAAKLTLKLKQVDKAETPVSKELKYQTYYML